ARRPCVPVRQRVLVDPSDRTRVRRRRDGLDGGRRATSRRPSGGAEARGRRLGWRSLLAHALLPAARALVTARSATLTLPTRFGFAKGKTIDRGQSHPWPPRTRQHTRR